MNFKFFDRIIFFAVFVGLFVFIFGLSENASAQKVKLRGLVNPNCSTGGNDPLAKFADISVDGNIAVQGSYYCKGAFIYDITNPDAPVFGIQI